MAMGLREFLRFKPKALEWKKSRVLTIGKGQKRTRNESVSMWTSYAEENRSEGCEDSEGGARKDGGGHRDITLISLTVRGKIEYCVESYYARPRQGGKRAILNDGQGSSQN